MTLGDNGFAVHEKVLDAAELDALSAELDSQRTSFSRAGSRHLLRHPAIAAIAGDPRLTAIASQWLGGAALPFKATLFSKSPRANWLVGWHQDTALPLEHRGTAPGWGPWSAKEGITYAHAPASALERVIALRIHLDDSTPDNGPLRVLPGTHGLGVLSGAQVHELARCVEPISCCAPAGGVVAMRPLIIHASSKCATPRSRRVLHVEYTVNLEVEPGMRLRAA